MPRVTSRDNPRLNEAVRLIASSRDRRKSGRCVLEGEHPGNVGSMLRTAAAAGVEQVVMSPSCAFAWSPKVLRAAQGAHFHLAIREGVDLVAWARDYEGRVVATVATGGVAVFEADLRDRV